MDNPEVAQQLRKLLITFGPETDVHIYSSRVGYTLKKIQISHGYLAGFRTEGKTELEVFIPLEKIRKIFFAPKPHSGLSPPRIHIYI